MNKVDQHTFQPMLIRGWVTGFAHVRILREKTPINMSRYYLYNLWIQFWLKINGKLSILLYIVDAQLENNRYLGRMYKITIYWLIDLTTSEKNQREFYSKSFFLTKEKVTWRNFINSSSLSYDHSTRTTTICNCVHKHALLWQASVIEVSVYVCMNVSLSDLGI